MARVLAIDRDLGVLEIVRVALADQGHEAILASNRTQVRRYLRSNRPDIILLTQRLDELSVLEQLQGLNLADFNGPLVVIAQNLRAETCSGALIDNRAIRAICNLCRDLTNRRHGLPIEVRPTSRATASRIVANRHVLAVLAQLDNDYRNPHLTTKLAAKKASISTAHLCRLMRQHTGKTFRTLLRQRRVAEAQRLLATSSSSVKEIAFCVGFASAGYLTHSFSKTCGISPRQYRDQVLIDLRQPEISVAPLPFHGSSRAARDSSSSLPPRSTSRRSSARRPPDRPSRL